MNKNEKDILRNCISAVSGASAAKAIWDMAIDDAVRNENLDEEQAEVFHTLTTALCGAVVACQAASLLNSIGATDDDYEENEDEDFEEESVPAPNVIVFDTDRHMKIIDIDDCFAEVLWFGDSNVLIPVPEIEGLFLTCQKENLMCAGDKEYLVGQAVVMRVDENRDPLSVTLEDGMNVCRIMDKRMGVLVNDRTKEKKKAFCLS